MVKGYRYTYKQTKKGARLRVRDSKGKIVRWEDAGGILDQPKEQYKIVEYTVNMGYHGRGRNNRPSNIHDFEVRIRLPEGASLQDVEDIAQNAMIENGFNDNFVYACTVNKKSGKDFIGYSNQEESIYKIIDIASERHYAYPKEGWGKINEYE